MNRPLIPLVVSYSLGLLTAHFELLPLSAALSILAVCFSLCIAAFLLRRRTAATVLGLCSAAAVGFCMLYPYTPQALSQAPIMRFVGSDRIHVEGVIDSTPVISEARTKLYVKTTHIHERTRSYAVHARLLVSIKEAAHTYHYGDRIRFFCSLKLPRNFQNPGGFDYVRYLAYRGISTTAFLTDDRGIITIREGEGNWFLLFVESVRDRIRNYLDGNLDSPVRDILKALIIGEQDTIPDTVRDQFATLGLTHLLSISGLHVSIFSLVTYLFLMFLFRLYYKPLLYINAFKVSVFLSIFPVLFYCCIAGFNIPTIRSAIMVVCYLISLLLGRKEDLVHTLFLAAFVTLLLIPASLFDLSFQLSFGAVLSIVLLVPRWQTLIYTREKDPFEKRIPFFERSKRLLLDSLLSSMAAILGTAPLVAISFHYFSFAGFVTNIIMIPLVTFLIVPVALLAAFMLFVSAALGSFLFAAAGLLIDLCLNCTAAWSRFPGAEIALSTPRLWEIAAYYLLLGSFFYFLQKKWMSYYIAAVCSFLIVEAALPLYQQQGTGMLQVTYLDVGGGDAAFVEFPGRHSMLIDGGGFMDESIDVGEMVLAPFLYSRGIRQVDVLVLSHPHQDHAGGLPYIAEHFGTQELWITGEHADFASYKRLRALAQRYAIKTVICSSAFPARLIDSVRIDVLGPEEIIANSSSAPQSDTNNNSLVLKCSYNKISFLFPADILQDGERMLLERQRPLAATIVKAPHHGSLSSSSTEFITAVSPAVAVFSCRSYGSQTLPHPEVLARYQQTGAKIYQTDRDGAIHVETDGETYRITLFNGKGNRGFK